jgi:tRNA(Glu) U13 pseudouridine synthase TruD
VQRFGIGGRNSTQGREILHGTSTEKKRMTPADVVFKLQAYASKIFNEYATQISESGKPLLDGDIVTRVGQGKFQYGIYEIATNTVVITETKGVNDKATFEVKASGKRIAYNAQTMLLT